MRSPDVRRSTLMPNLGSPELDTPIDADRATPQPTVSAARPRSGRSALRGSALRLLADRWAVQIDAYAWRRYALMKPFLPRGPIDALNVGTGGGVETLRLLRCGHRVTTIDIDPVAARRTRGRAERWACGDRHRGKVGHVLHVDVAGPFQLILMAEVLEHIA